MPKYKKTIKNPLGLGKGLVITDNEFTDTDFNDVNKKKLKNALRVGAVKLIDAKDEAKKVANTNDAKIADLETQLETAKNELATALGTIKELQNDSEDAWKTMSVDELKDAYTVPELKAFCDELEVTYKSNSKETSLANKIVEAFKGDNIPEWKLMTADELVEAFDVDQLKLYADELDLTYADAFTSDDLAEIIVEALQE